MFTTARSYAASKSRMLASYEAEMARQELANREESIMAKTAKPAKVVKTAAKARTETTDDDAARLAAENEGGVPSAGPTPEMQADDPPEAFEPPEDEPDITPKPAAYPSAGPTPEMQKDDPPEAFEPAPEPPKPDDAEPVQPLPSAGPTPEMQEQAVKDADEAEKAKRDFDKGASARDKKRDAVLDAVEKLKADGFLVPYVETHASPDDVKNLYVLKAG